MPPKPKPHKDRMQDLKAALPKDERRSEVLRKGSHCAGKVRML